MRLIEHDDMFRALATDGSDQPFRDAVLPGRPERDRLVTDAYRSQSARHDGAVYLISIADQVKWSFIPRKCFRDLTCNLFRARMRRYVDPDKISAGQSDDDEDVKRLESDARNHE